MIVSEKLRKSAGHHNAYCTNVEEWRPVDGWDGLYEVSSKGRVRSVPRVMPCSNGKRRRCPSRVIAQRATRSGYLVVQLCRSGREKTALVHRLVASAFVHGIGDVVRHLDGVPSNNIPPNLAWGSAKENAADKIRHGTHLCGERHPQASMTESDVAEILRMHAAGISQLEIARRTGFGRGGIGYVVRRETWRHVK